MAKMKKSRKPRVGAHMRLNRPTIRFKFGREMWINRQSLRALNNPNNVHFFWHPKGRALLIGAVPNITALTIGINSLCYESRQGVCIKSTPLMNALLRACGWRRDRIYSVNGKYFPDLGVLLFKMDDAVVSSDTAEPVTSARIETEAALDE